MLAYEVAGGTIDEYLRMSKTTCLDSMYMFCKIVTLIFSKVYPREPNVADTAQLLSINGAREFTG
jgi:hypothetical protein